MIINTTKYSLSNKNFIEVQSPKKQIVIGHTDSGKNNFAKWSHRLHGRYTKTSAFTIDKNGDVYRHFDPVYSSNILGNTEMDKKSIVILLENEGWLVRDEKKDLYINWVGHIYNKPKEIIEKKWRSYTYWAPYTQEQFDSTLELVNNLCDEFDIPKIVVNHNTKMDDLNKFSGVLYKSNIEKHFTDLSPSWDFELFCDKLEKK